MFTAATFQLIKNHSLKDFESLLKNLSISVPDWTGNEFQIYEEVDGELTEKICGLMKSPTIIDGYMNLLDMGGVTYTYSETDSELLGKIVANKDKILRGSKNLSKSVEVETLPPQQKKSPEPKTNWWKIWGAILILAALGCIFVFDKNGETNSNEIIGGVSALLGIYFLRKDLPVESEPESKPVKQTSVRKETKPPFTRNELQRTLDILTQLHKIICAI